MLYYRGDLSSYSVYVECATEAKLHKTKTLRKVEAEEIQIFRSVFFHQFLLNFIDNQNRCGWIIIQCKRKTRETVVQKLHTTQKIISSVHKYHDKSYKCRENLRRWIFLNFIMGSAPSRLQLSNYLNAINAFKTASTFHTDVNVSTFNHKRHKRSTTMFWKSLRK